MKHLLMALLAVAALLTGCKKTETPTPQPDLTGEWQLQLVTGKDTLPEGSFGGIHADGTASLSYESGQAVTLLLRRDGTYSGTYASPEGSVAGFYLIENPKVFIGLSQTAVQTRKEYLELLVHTDTSFVATHYVYYSNGTMESPLFLARLTFEKVRD